MALYEFEGKRPSIGTGSFIPETADVIGDVTIGEKCFIGVWARIRGDYGTIVIGSRTSVQENSVIHARDGYRTVVGDNVQLGHGCILHNCTVKSIFRGDSTRLSRPKAAPTDSDSRFAED
jgi:phenylacetic acid degradation protein